MPNHVLSASGCVLGKALIPTMTDFVERCGHKVKVVLMRKPCRHLGERTEVTTKTNCKTPTYAPVYRCETFRLASPFGQSVDAELIHPCEACKQYEAQQ